MSGNVIKFGGTSLGDAVRVGRAADAIVAAQQLSSVVVVVSAMAGVTRRLHGIAALAAAAPALALDELDSLLDEHRDVAVALGCDAGVIVEACPDALRQHPQRLLAAIAAQDGAARDVLLATGERLSATLLREALARRHVAASAMAAETLIRTDSMHGHADVDQAVSATNIKARDADFAANRVTIVPGFTGASADGSTTTLGRNSSDYSAALIAAALGWPLQIWTDVAGCYDADPRLVPGAQLLRTLSLGDAHRYARAGASVIHPRTLEPLLLRPVPLSIVNSFAADVAGTRFVDQDGDALHGIAVRNDVHLLRGIGVDQIDCFDRGDNRYGTSPAGIVDVGQRDSVAVALLSVFDDRGAGDLTEHCLRALTQVSVQALALWWSTRERCVRIAVLPGDAEAIGRCLHGALFTRQPTVIVNLAVIGTTGRVGGRVLELVAERQRAWLRKGIELRVVAIANSRRARVDVDGIDVATIADTVESAVITPIETWSHDLLALPQRPLILLDCTASATVAGYYPEWLAAGIDIVTPNKHGPAADAALSRAIATAQGQSGARLMVETTVGAQLPLLRTLRDLHAAGDQIQRLEAVLSGTLSYVLNRVRAGIRFSDATREAIDLGYAEPHPGADLSGADAARKLTILLRALGVAIQTCDIEVVAPVSAALLQEADPAALLSRLSSEDAGWATSAAQATASGQVWIYRASYADGVARVAPERIPATHPLAHLLPCENALRLSTRYYASAPLTIAGPGAGIDLTAAGVYADLADVLHRYLPVLTKANMSSPALPHAA